MSGKRHAIGTVGWIDLTVPNADSVRDFYKAVVGWKAEGLDMGGYSDYVMSPPTEGAEPVAGVCHARGVNNGLPASWLAYFIVADLDASVQQVEAMGGTVVRPPTKMGPQGRFAVIRDPSGAACAIFQSPPQQP
jgi:predicted enzyme related to lactoylglutathione lyase